MTAGMARLRTAGAAWPALAFYLGAWPAGLAGEWTAVWLFVFSGSVLAVALGRAALHQAPRAVLSNSSASSPDAPD